MRLPVWIERRAALTPESPALLSDATGPLSWRALAARVRSVAARLRHLGVASGDTLATWVADALPAVELFYAAPLLGAELVPLNPRWTGRELAGPLAECGARWLLHGPELESKLPETHAAHLRRVPWPPEALERNPGAPRLEEEMDLERTACVVYTSGTSGEPKGVELGHTQLLFGAVASSMHLGALPEDRWLLCVPLHHVAGLAILVRAVLFGASLVLHPRFDAARVSQALDAERITLISLVPTMLKRLLEVRAGAPPPASLRCVLLGGGPIPETLLEAAWSEGWPVAPTYGLTETAAQVATLPLTEIGRRRGVRPLLPNQIAVVDAEGRPLPPEREGEIQVRGPSVMRGYRGRPAETAAAFRDGWLRTGDIGFLDGDGLLHVLERRSDLIVTGGENVMPREVEDVLRRHPDVADAGVAAEPDLEYGQRVAAWVVLRRGARPAPEALLAFCREQLAGYKLPRTIRFVDALPRSASGKLLRRRLPQLGGAAGESV